MKLIYWRITNKCLYCMKSFNWVSTIVISIPHYFTWTRKKAYPKKFLPCDSPNNTCRYVPTATPKPLIHLQQSQGTFRLLLSAYRPSSFPASSLVTGDNLTQICSPITMILEHLRLYFTIPFPFTFSSSVYYRISLTQRVCIMNTLNEARHCIFEIGVVRGLFFHLPNTNMNKCIYF
jgi:hypothetical protein